MQKHFQVNTATPLLLANALYNRLREVTDVPHGAHCVIHVLDQKVHNLNPDYFSYTFSKLALKLHNVSSLRVGGNGRIPLRFLAFVLEGDQNGFPHRQLIVHPDNVDGLGSFIDAPLEVPRGEVRQADTGAHFC